MQIYIVSISILLLNPNRSTVAHWSHLSSSNLGDFIRGVRLHRNGLNVTEIEIEIEVHKSFTCCSTSLRFVMKRYVADMSCTLLTINQHRERTRERGRGVGDRWSTRICNSCARNPLGLLHEQHESSEV